MQMKAQVIEAIPRDMNGSTLTKLRATGEIPAIVYGIGSDPTPISVSEKAFQGFSALRKSLVELTVAGKKVNTIVQDVQRHPVTKKILHIDFLQVDLNQPIDTKVPLHVVGIEEVERRGGVVQQQTHEVELHALPQSMPEVLTVDVSDLEVGESVSVGTIKIPSGVEFRSDPNEVVASVIAGRRDATSAETEAEVDADAEDGAGTEAGTKA
jgi:large subunit ribosomal protein L25